MSEKSNIGIVTYDVGILGAEIKLTALSSKQGRVQREGCSWELKKLDQAGEVDSSATVQRIEAAQGSMILPPARYAIHFIRDGEDRYSCLAQVTLKQNTSTDIVFIFEEGRQDDDEYFADHDAVDDFSRRQQQREDQSLYGYASLPLRDPSTPTGDMGTQFMAHPLLQNAQFDGVPPDMRADPHDNQAALELTLQNKLQAQATPSITPPTATP